MKERVISSINLKTLEEDAWVILPPRPKAKKGKKAERIKWPWPEKKKK